MKAFYLSLIASATITLIGKVYLITCNCGKVRIMSDAQVLGLFFGGLLVIAVWAVWYLRR